MGHERFIEEDHGQYHKFKEVQYCYFLFSDNLYSNWPLFYTLNETLNTKLQWLIITLEIFPNIVASIQLMLLKACH